MLQAPFGPDTRNTVCSTIIAIIVYFNILIGYLENKLINIPEEKSDRILSALLTIVIITNADYSLRDRSFLRHAVSAYNVDSAYCSQD